MIKWFIKRQLYSYPGYKRIKGPGRLQKEDNSRYSQRKNRVIKILEDANIKLSSVLSNVDGAVGKKIITDIIEGKHNPDELLKHYHGKMKASKQTLKKSLEGRITKHHQFMLKLIKQSITDKENLITTLDAQIDAVSKAYMVEIELLQTIPGVGKSSAISILSEVGGDMEVFATDHHLSNWAGMSPGNNESGGKKKYQNHPRKQTPAINLSRMWLGGYPN